MKTPGSTSVFVNNFSSTLSIGTELRNQRIEDGGQIELCQRQELSKLGQSHVW